MLFRSTMDMFSPYYDIARKLFPKAKIVLDRFHMAGPPAGAGLPLRLPAGHVPHLPGQEVGAVVDAPVQDEGRSEVSTLKKEKESLYSQIIEIRKEVEHTESVRNCVEKLQQENKKLSREKSCELIV